MLKTFISKHLPHPVFGLQLDMLFLVAGLIYLVGEIKSALQCC